MRPIDELAAERVEVLDDGALKFVMPNGEIIGGEAPGCTQPRGDWRQMPAAHATWKFRGDRMDLGLAVDVLLQQTNRAKGVPAGTSTVG
jgi:hypothetical protein